jgi:hypothetical protein
MCRNSLVVIIATCLVVCAATMTDAQTYHAVAMEPLPGTFVRTVFDMNNSSQVVGILGRFEAVIWDRSSQPRRLPVPQWVTSMQINNAGLIAGTRLTGGGSTELFLIHHDTYVPVRMPVRARAGDRADR